MFTVSPLKDLFMLLLFLLVTWHQHLGTNCGAKYLMIPDKEWEHNEKASFCWQKENLVWFFMNIAMISLHLLAQWFSNSYVVSEASRPCRGRDGVGERRKCDSQDCVTTELTGAFLKLISPHNILLRMWWTLCKTLCTSELVSTTHFWDHDPQPTSRSNNVIIHNESDLKSRSGLQQHFISIMTCREHCRGVCGAPWHHQFEKSSSKPSSDVVLGLHHCLPPSPSPQSVRGTQAGGSQPTSLRPLY